MHLPTFTTGAAKRGPALRAQGSKARRRGAAVVEFAIVAPVAILFILGAVEFGRAMLVHALAVNAARSACRQAVLASATDESIESAVNEIMEDSGITGVRTQVLVAGEDNELLSRAAPGTPIQVIVTIPYSENSWIPSPFYLSGRALTGMVTMSKE
jgi:Flp pilus assembly protein TadG